MQHVHHTSVLEEVLSTLSWGHLGVMCACEGAALAAEAERETPFLQQIVAAAKEAAKKTPSRLYAFLFRPCVNLSLSLSLSFDYTSQSHEA